MFLSGAVVTAVYSEQPAVDQHAWITSPEKSALGQHGQDMIL